MISGIENTADPATAEKARWKYGATLAACVLVQIVLAVWFHWGRSFIGDEWGSYAALSRPYSELLTQFGGWTTMNFYLAGLKFVYDVFGGENWLLVLPGLACSAGLVLLGARLTRLLGGGETAAGLAAFLIATSPYLIWYAVTIRSYALLATFTTAMVVALLSWRKSGRWFDGVVCGILGALALLAHLNAVYGIVAVAGLGVLWSKEAKRGARLLVPLAVCVGLAAAAHLPMLEGIRQFRGQWSGDGFIWPTYLPAVAARYFGAWPMWVVGVGLFAATIVHAFVRRTDVRWLLVLIAAPVVGVFLVRVSHAPAAYARFMIASLPLVLVAIAMLLGTRRGVTVALVTLFTVCNALHFVQLRSNASSVPFREIAAAVRERGADRVVMLGSFVHRFGMAQVGITLEENLLSTITALPPDQTVSITIIDGFGVTNSLESRQLGSQRVATFTGPVREIADGLADLMIQRLGEQPNRALQRELAAELLPVLVWLGRDEDAIIVRPIAEAPPPDSRIR